MSSSHSSKRIKEWLPWKRSKSSRDGRGQQKDDQNSSRISAKTLEVLPNGAAPVLSQDNQANPVDGATTSNGKVSNAPQQPAAARDQERLFDKETAPMLVQDLNSIPSTTQSIWDRAYEALRETSPNLLAKYELLLKQDLLSDTDRSTPMPDNMTENSLDPSQRQMCLDQMAAAGQKRQETKGKVYVFGHAISIQESLRAIGDGVTFAKAWIGEAVQASPEASVAWAVVCLALPLLTRPSDVNQVNSDGFAYVSSRMRYYIAMEDLLLTDFGSNRSLQELMKDQIKDLYQKIIDFQIRSILRYHSNTVKTIADDTFGLRDWKGMLKAIQTLEDQIYKAADQVATVDTRAHLVKLQSDAVEYHSQMQRLQEELLEVSKNQYKVQKAMLKIMEQNQEKDLDYQQRLKLDAKRKLEKDGPECIQLFSLEPSYTFFKGQVPEHVPGTCGWFLSQPVYRKWLSQHSGSVLVSADPGCGKSVLAKRLVDHELPKECPEARIAYFFFKDQQQNRLSTALCGILHQLLDDTLVRHAIRHYKKFGKNLVSNIESLFEILENVINDPEAGAIILVLDAMDECDETDSRYFFRLLNQSGTRTNFKILLTSRPYNNILFNFEEQDGPSAIRIRIPGELESEAISEEINLVLRHRLNKLVLMNRLDARTRPMLEKSLMAVEHHRTYLWAFLVFDELENFLKKSPKEMERYMKNIPKNVSNAYEKILSKIMDDEENQDNAYQVLRIMLGAVRPLSPQELQIALLFPTRATSLDELEYELIEEEDFKYKIRQWCGLLIQIHNNKVVFLHQTVREFLLSRGSSTTRTSGSLPTEWRGSIDIRRAHESLARSCIYYLNQAILQPAVNIGDTNDHGSLDKVHQKDYIEINAFTVGKEEGTDEGDLQARIESDRDDTDFAENKSDSYVKSTKFPFLLYSTEHWDTHFEEGDCLEDKDLMDTAVEICTPSKGGLRTPCTTSLEWYYHETLPGRLAVACSLNSRKLVKALLDANDNQTKSRSNKQDALLMASAYKRWDNVKLLLDSDTITDHDENTGYVPLLWIESIG